MHFGLMSQAGVAFAAQIPFRWVPHGDAQTRRLVHLQRRVPDSPFPKTLLLAGEPAGAPRTAQPCAREGESGALEQAGKEEK